MAESSRISTSSTNDVPPLSKQQGNVSQNISQIPLIEANPKKRFKNLVECYPCIVDDCQILFDSKKELDEHKATHVKLYKCDFKSCEKSFSKIVNLRKHCKSHYKNKKIYFCPYEGCNKSFSAYYSLNSHYRIHTGNMPFRCEICDKNKADVSRNMSILIDKGLVIKEGNNQNLYWLRETIDQAIRSRFYNNQRVIAAMEKAEEDVRSARQTSFRAAEDVLETYFNSELKS